MEFHWNIEDLIFKKNNGCVYKIHYCLETYANGHSTCIRDTVNISGSSSDPNFIRLRDLEHDVVLGWITGSLPVEEMKAELSSSFSLLENGTYLDGFPDNFWS